MRRSVQILAATIALAASLLMPSDVYAEGIKNGNFGNGLTGWTSAGTGITAENGTDADGNDKFAKIGPGDGLASLNSILLSQSFECAKDPEEDGACHITFSYQWNPKAGDNERMKVWLNGKVKRAGKLASRNGHRRRLRASADRHTDLRPRRAQDRL